MQPNTSPNPNFLSNLLTSAVKDDVLNYVTLTAEIILDLWLVRTKLPHLKLLCNHGYEARPEEGEEFSFKTGEVYGVRQVGRNFLELLSEDRTRSFKISAYDICIHFSLGIGRSTWSGIQGLVSELKTENEQLFSDLMDSFLDKETFEIGDNVKWKKGLADGMWPTTDQICTVIEILDPPAPRPRNNSVSPHGLGARLDIICAVLDYNDGEVMHFLYDSRRFTKKGVPQRSDKKS